MTQQDGASVNARNKIPSTDLACVIDFLVKAFPPDESRSGHPLSWPVLKFDPAKNRLSINTYGIMHRFLAQKEMLSAFRQTETSGFLRDLVSPPKNFTAKMGGRIFDDNITGLSQNIIKLKQLITDDIKRLGVSPDNILVSDPTGALQDLANMTGIKDFLKEVPVQMVAIEFAKPERLASIRDKDIARVLSATEEIQAENWLKRMSDNIIEMQSSQDDEFCEIQRDKLIETLKQDFDKQDSQITRFLNFLEDEALARVRLKVSFAIMESLAAQVAKSDHANSRRFVHYVRRVTQLFEFFGTPESPHALQLNLSSDYGIDMDFSISQELVKATFYNCLPVWAEWNTQLFESRSADILSKGVSVIRDVSYRFRVNGKDPRNDRLPAFDARLKRLREMLIEHPSSELSPFISRRSLSEVVFLWLILNPTINSSDLFAEAKQLTERLNVEGKSGVSRLLDDLLTWSPAVKGISTTLISLLRTKSRNVIDHAQKSIDDLFLVVQQGVVDGSSIERSRGKASEPLVKPVAGESEKVEWFRHIKITRKPNEVLNALFSIQVRTKLNERTLITREEGNTTIQVIRESPQKLLNITWMPMRVDKKQSPVKCKDRANIEPAWRMSAGVDIWYDPELLKYSNNPSFTEEDKRQYRAAAATAMAVLVYIVLQVLSEKLTKPSGESLLALMLRFQTQGKKAAENEGDHFVYAMSKAIESALMRDIPVRMQGLVTDGDRRYKDRGAAFALSAAFPLVISATSKPSVDKIAVVIYATRPCDDYPGAEDTAGFIFQAKTYLADAVNEPLDGYRLAFDRMQTHIVETRDAFKSPKLIVEEVSRLHAMGYEHIILISSHFGNPRINRSAQRHSPHTQTAFLDEVATKFANVNIYMLRRDVFPATRLHTRARSESAFEAARISDHDEFAIDQSADILKRLIPIYTFATLAVVGDDVSRPQSGFCTYFLDADYRVRNTEWRERVRSNLLSSGTGTRGCLLSVLRGLHFLEAEKQPEGGVFKPVLDPFGWVKPTSSGGAGEIEALPSSRRKGNVLLSLPAILSHVTEALHRGIG